MGDKKENTRGACCLIVVPTYRERDNIGKLQAAFAKQKLSYALLVIDDGSDDGTHQLLRSLQLQKVPVTVLQRHRKLGLGSAYVLGLACARQGKYRYVIQMDADLSHRPADVLRLIESCDNHDVVVGSRYTKGGRCEGWPWHRYLLSRSANWLARSMLGLEPKDVTGGFRCIRRTFLDRLSLEDIVSTGFAFQCDFNQLAASKGARFVEIPICFCQRLVGKSKMSIAIMIEGFWRLVQIKYQVRILRRKAKHQRKALVK